jgi:Rrf2 family nitric oxide-sensitive transcriptional repressor
MQLTLHADYAFRVLLYLAANRGRLVSTAEMGKAYGISTNHLVKVVLHLNQHGFIRSHRGRTGGNELAMEPSKINLGHVLRCVEPDFKIVECFDEETNTCPILSVCGLKGALGKASHAFMAVLDRCTLADVITPDTESSFKKCFVKPLVEAVSASP